MKIVFPFLYLLMSFSAYASDDYKNKTLIYFQQNNEVKLINHLKKNNYTPLMFSFKVGEFHKQVNTPNSRTLLSHNEFYMLYESDDVSVSIIDIACDKGFVNTLKSYEAKNGKASLISHIKDNTSCVQASIRNWDMSLYNYLNTLGNGDIWSLTKSFTKTQKMKKYYQGVIANAACIHNKSEAEKLCIELINKKWNPLPTFITSFSTSYLYGDVVFANISKRTAIAMVANNLLTNKKVSFGGVYGDTDTSHMHMAIKSSKFETLMYIVKNKFNPNIEFLQDEYPTNINTLNANSQLNAAQKKLVKEELIKQYNKIGYKKDDDKIISSLLSATPNITRIRKALTKYNGYRIYDPKSGVRLIEIAKAAGNDNVKDYLITRE